MAFLQRSEQAWQDSGSRMRRFVPHMNMILKNEPLRNLQLEIPETVTAYMICNVYNARAFRPPKLA